MATVVTGSRDELIKRPLFHCAIDSVSPLRWEVPALDFLPVLCKSNTPILVGSEVLSGGTAPVTLAGTIAQANAEVLSGILLVQLLNKGNPVFYSIGYSHVLDMTTAEALCSGPEHALIILANSELAQNYNLPSHSLLATDSKTCDHQSGYETMMEALMTVLARPTCVLGVGLVNVGLSMDPVKAVMDNELIEVALRIAEGIEVNESTISLDVIKSVGIGGNFLEHYHTLKHYKSSLKDLKITDRLSLGAWQKRGSKDMTIRAREITKKILQKHKVTPLSRDIQNKFGAIIRRAKTT